jgi:hypothetical protein
MSKRGVLLKVDGFGGRLYIYILYNIMKQRQS